MVWVLTGLAGLVCLWAVAAGYLAVTRSLDYRQALLYAPLKAAFLIRGDRLPAFDKNRGTIYVVSHRTRLDPAVMLSLLPSDTLHILDHDTATTWWMEPYRELARTIPFNATHVFVSRRLVRLLRGNGSIAVYLPDDPEPDTRAFRLFRAVARIALKADAAVVPIRLGRPGSAISDRSVSGRIEGWPSPNLALSVVAPATVADLRQRPGANMITASNALFDRVAQTRISDVERLGTSFAAVVHAARRFGDGHAIHLVQPGRSSSFGEVLRQTRLLASRMARRTQEGDLVGLYLPGSDLLLPAFLATQSAGVGAVLFDDTHDTEAAAQVARQVAIRKVLTSRNLADARKDEMLAALETAGARIHFVEDILDGAGQVQRALAGLMRHLPVARSSPDATAAFVQAPDGWQPLSHRRLLMSAAQLAARLRLRGAAAMVSALPLSQADGIALGLLLPLASGTPLRLEPAGIPDASFVNLEGTVLVLAPAERAKEFLTVKHNAVTQLRVVLCTDGSQGPQPVSSMERRGIDVLEAFAPTPETGLVTLSSASHRRATTLGRFLPSLRFKLAAVEGIERGGHLLVVPAGMDTDRLEANDADRRGSATGAWIDTGMLVSLDREGFVSCLGRSGRSATIDGREVPLAPGEYLAARAWPEAQHLAVGIVDRRRGERIVLLTTQGDADKAQLKRLARGLGLSDILLPADIVQVDDLPDTEQAGDIATRAAGRTNSRAA